MPKHDLKESLEKKSTSEEAYLRPVSGTGYEGSDPNAPRKYKGITVTFNEFEYQELETVCKVLSRGKNDTIRFLIRDKLRELNQY